jgi:hypothetical protein
MASTYLQRTGISAGNRRTWTFSAWVKRTALGEQRIFNHEQSSGTSQISVLKWDGSNKILYADNSGSGNSIDLNSSNMVFRDVNAWYHIVLRVDTTDATANNRARIYVNGQDIYSELGGFSTHTQPSQNYDTFANQSGNKITIGAWVNNTTQYFDGCMSHIHFADGQALAPTVFGSTDNVTGQWKINTSPSFTLGTNGFTILKDGNTITDQSANSNDFTLGGGTLTNTEDNPSNVFPILNQLNAQSSGYTFDGLGSLSVTGNTGDAWRTMYATFGASSGKYYWEQKITNFTGVDPHYIGIVSDDQMSNLNIDQATTSRGYFYTKTGDKRNNNSQSSYGNSWTTNDIVGVALDLDNSKVFFSKNGVFQNSGDPANGTNPAFTITSGYTYIPATSTYYNLNRYDMNFGNGYFGTTAISSEGTNASGIGKFEYDVPTGYTALSTKGLNE